MAFKNLNKFDEEIIYGKSRRIGISRKKLKDAGVECIFTLSGGHIFRLFHECEKAGIRVLDVKHEGAAAYAAMGYAQVTGKMGVVVATAGPGVTNTLTAIVDSQIYDVPVLLIGGGGAGKTGAYGNPAGF